MKKILIILFASLLCFGCGKRNNITININENEKSNTSQINEEIKENSKDTIKDDLVEDTKKQDNTISSDSEKGLNLDSAKDKAKETYDKVKSWYDENKDELKDINKEILEDDLNTLKEASDKLKDWYEDKTSEDSNSILSKVKIWYNNNKDNIKDAAKESLSSDKEVLSDLFNK